MLATGYPRWCAGEVTDFPDKAWQNRDSAVQAPRRRFASAGARRANRAGSSASAASCKHHLGAWRPGFPPL